MDVGSILQQYGLAGLVIFILSTVVVFLYKEGKGTQKKYDEMQDTRLNDARETRDKLVEPIEKLAKQQEQTNELLIKLFSNRKS